MPECPDLAELLADPARVAEVPAEQVPACLAALAAEQTRLAAVQGALAARLTATAPTGNGREDRLLTAEEVHARTTVSIGWLYRHARALPFTRRIGRKVLFSEAALAKWLATREP